MGFSSFILVLAEINTIMIYATQILLEVEQLLDRKDHLMQVLISPNRSTLPDYPSSFRSKTTHSQFDQLSG